MAHPTLTNRWAVLGVIFAARASMALQFQSIPPIASFLSRDLGLSYGQIGTLIGLFMLPGVALALPGGLIGQRFGDKRVTVAALGLLTGGAVLLSFAPSFAWAFAARLLGGVGILLLNVVTTKMTADWFAERDTSTAMGIMLSAWPTGIAIALSSLGALAAATTWQTAVQATAATTAVIGAVLAIFYADPPPASALGAAALGAAPQRAPQRLWRITRREVALSLAIGAVWTLINASFILVLAFGPAFLAGRGYTIGMAGLVISLVSWACIASVPLGGWLMDRVGRHRAFIVVGALLSAATVVGLLSGQLPVLWSVLYGVIAGGWASATMTLASQAISPESRHTGFGLFYTVYYGGLAVAPPLAGWLQDATGTAAAALWLACGLMVLALPALLVFHLLQRRIGA